MKEITFLRKNHEKWLEFEKMLNSKDAVNPDVLSDLFVRITDDLSWARTFYPGSSTERYLNDLAARIHQEIYKNKKESRSRLVTFWTNEFPLLMRGHLGNLMIAFLIFAVSVWIGIISAQNDSEFVRIILGDYYVDSTLDNMANGDPMGVYKSENQFAMFFRIALNNSFVALMCIMVGVFHWMGVGFMLFRNGVMLGCFMYFLGENGFLREATLTVWIHGVIEIWCIIVAGAAGIALGNSIWFPGAWPRSVAFGRGAREALKIGLALIPFFFLAAFFEGFITRYTQMPDVGRIAIIAGSAVFVLWYFVFYPQILFYKQKKNEAGMSSRIAFVLWLVTLPVSAPILFIINRSREKKLSPRDLFAQINPRTVFMVISGFVLIFLPLLSFVMQLVTGIPSDTTTYIFFGLLAVCGVIMIVLALLWNDRIEEEDLSIARKSDKILGSYER
jgi:uncharacterized membrane protein SpoIIM required for sporulation